MITVATRAIFAMHFEFSRGPEFKVSLSYNLRYPRGVTGPKLSSQELAISKSSCKLPTRLRSRGRAVRQDQQAGRLSHVDLADPPSLQGSGGDHDLHGFVDGVERRANPEWNSVCSVDFHCLAGRRCSLWSVGKE